MKSTEALIREQGTASVVAYRKRVYRLAGIYLGLVLLTPLVNGLILVYGKLFVTLSARSNVEPLILSVILALCTYLFLVSLPGAWGAVHILWHNWPAWVDGGARPRVEVRKQAALKPTRPTDDQSVYLNCQVRRATAAFAQTAQPIEIALSDASGSLGRIVIDGVKLTHEGGMGYPSNTLLAYFEQQLQQLVQVRQPQVRVQIVQWASIDDEAALQYASLVVFMGNVAKALGAAPLWPQIELTAQDLASLQRQGRALCPILRDEAHLPDLEYGFEQRLPIIPEPLGFIVLSRQERRADPLVSLGCALVATLVILGLLLLIIWWPPWVP